jgi:hypothetical protein
MLIRSNRLMVTVVDEWCATRIRMHISPPLNGMRRRFSVVTPWSQRNGRRLVPERRITRQATTIATSDVKNVCQLLPLAAKRATSP